MNKNQIDVALGRGQAINDMNKTLLTTVAGLSNCWSELMNREPDLMNKHPDIALRYRRLQVQALREYDQAKARIERLRPPSC